MMHRKMRSVNNAAVFDMSTEVPLFDTVAVASVIKDL
jgi:hypothetical protein